MPKVKILLIPWLVIILAGALIALNRDKLLYRAPDNKRLVKSKTSALLARHKGEKITYDISLGKLRLGKALFTQLGDTEINGQRLNLMVLETRLARFTDTEKIYSDPQTLLPVKVERDILNWLIREKIREEYNQQNFTVTITKKTTLTPENTTTIKKSSPIHNAVLLPYSIRYLPKLEIGQTITTNLPGRALEIRLVSIEEVHVPAGLFKAFHFESTPKQIDIWVTADERRIPIKIQNKGSLGYSLAMSEYAL